MHNHCRVEKLPNEILEAFKANDRQHSGTIHSKHLKHLLQGWGEHLNSKEGMLFIILKLNGLGDTNIQGLFFLSSLLKKINYYQ